MYGNTRIMTIPETQYLFCVTIRVLCYKSPVCTKLNILDVTSTEYPNTRISEYRILIPIPIPIPDFESYSDNRIRIRYPVLDTRYPISIRKPYSEIVSDTDSDNRFRYLIAMSVSGLIN